jgi:hypothetical protein
VNVAAMRTKSLWLATFQNFLKFSQWFQLPSELQKTAICRPKLSGGDIRNHISDPMLRGVGAVPGTRERGTAII